MARTRVLVIDDDRNILDIMRTTLERAGLEVLPAPDGDIGVRMFREEQPDIAIVDIAMPGVDGYAVIERIREVEGETDHPMPVIILSAYSQAAMRKYASDLGVSLYLTKPAQPKLLVRYIQELTGGPVDSE
jgi:DNA-binding response OmpR family regulator